MKQHQRVVGSSTDDADDDLESPRNFLKKKNAVEALPDSDSPAAGAAAVKARAVRSSSITARAVAFEGVKPLRLERFAELTRAYECDFRRFGYTMLACVARSRSLFRRRSIALSAAVEIAPAAENSENSPPPLVCLNRYQEVPFVIELDSLRNRSSADVESALRGESARATSRVSAIAGGLDSLACKRTVMPMASRSTRMESSERSGEALAEAVRPRPSGGGTTKA